MIKFSEFGNLKEAVKLTPAELEKPNSSTGEKRADILIRLIKQGSPIELAKGGTVKVEYTPELIQSIEQWRDDTSNKKPAIAFLSIDGQPYTTSDLAKSKVFGGGGGGAGGGTLNTKITESHQCVMCQAMLDHGVQDEEFFTPDILKAAYKKVEVDAKLDEVLSVEDGWFHSSYESAKLLVKERYIHKNHVFHRGSKTMTGIYALKDIAFKNSGFPKLKDDKWNPGDIWAVEKGFNIQKELNVENVKSLNASILENFVNRRLVGISLKLVKKQAKSKDYNVKLPPDTDDHKVMKVLLQGEKRGEFWSSKGATIVFDAGKLMLKDNSPGGNVKAEILGKTARGGGASWGIIQDASRQVFRKNLPDHKGGVYQIAKKIHVRKDPKAIAIFWRMFNYFYPNVPEKEFLDELSKKDTNWISSKLGCMYVCYYCDLNTGQKANRFITKIVNYAGSKSEDASTFVKVYE